MLGVRGEGGFTECCSYLCKVNLDLLGPIDQEGWALNCWCHCWEDKVHGRGCVVVFVG